MAKGCRAIVTKDGSQAVNLDGLTGINHQVTGTDLSVLQDAMNNILDSGRDYPEKVCAYGDFTIADASAPLKIPSYTTLELQGRIKTDTTLCTNFVLQNANPTTGNTDISLIGGTYDGISGTLTTGSEVCTFIDFQKVTRFLIQGITCVSISGECTFLGLSGVQNSGVNAGTIRDVTITDGAVGGGFAVLGNSYNITFSGNHLFTWDTTITIYNGRGIHVDHNDLAAHSSGGVGGGPCLEITPQSAADTDQDIYATYNTCWSSHSKGVWIHQNNAGACGIMQDITIQGWTFRGIDKTSGGNTGVEIGQFCAVTRLHIIENSFLNIPNQAIFLSNNAVSALLTDSNFDRNFIKSPGQEAIRLVGIQNSSISGNRIQNSTGAGIHLIRLSGTACSKFNMLTGNIIEGSTGGGGNGIVDDSVCDDWQIITNNLFQNNAQAAVSKLAGATNTVVRYNLGYKTENQGSSTISASTSVVFAHGLIGVPTSVAVTLGSTGYGTFAVTAIDGTNITVTVTTSGTYTVYWSAVYWP